MTDSGEQGVFKQTFAVSHTEAALRKKEPTE